MSIDTGLPTSDPRPQTSHRFVYLGGGSQLTPLAQRVALVGTMGTGAGVTGAADTVYDIGSSEDGDTLFKAGSEIACMIRDAFRAQRALGRGPRISAVGVAEPAAGAAATFTLTLGGPATESGNLVIRACGRRYPVGVTKDDDAAAMATAVGAALGADAANLPFSVAVAAGVVTATYNHKGVNGKDLKFSVDSAPAGVTVAIAAGVVGAGSLDLTNAYAALEPLDVDAVIVSVRTVADVDAALAHVQAMWAVNEKKWRWIVFGDTETLGTATALATEANDRAIIVGSVEACPAMPFTLATLLGVGAFSRERPNANYDKLVLPLAPPPIASAYTGTEVKTAILAGVTVMTPVQRGQQIIDGVCKIERLVTTKTTENGQPYYNVRDLAVPRTAAYLARQLDIRYEIEFGADANPDGALLDEDSADKVRHMVAGVWHDAAAERYITNVDADLEQLVVAANPDADGRFDAETAQTVIVGLHQVAYKHNVKIGGAL